MDTYYDFALHVKFSVHCFITVIRSPCVSTGIPYIP